MLDEPPVFGQHPGMVHADAMTHQPAQGLAESRGETESANELGDPVLFLTGADVDTHQVLRPFYRFHLAEVHHIDRHLLGGEQFLERFVDWRFDVVIVQRDGPLG